jgi:hypothetical protein
MTRIYTIGLENRTEKEGAYLVIQVAHRNSAGAERIAKKEAGQRGGHWRVVHLAERRTGLAIPEGEVMGASGPFTFTLDHE